MKIKVRKGIHFIEEEDVCALISYRSETTETTKIILKNEEIIECSKRVGQIYESMEDKNILTQLSRAIYLNIKEIKFLNSVDNEILFKNNVKLHIGRLAKTELKKILGSEE